MKLNETQEILSTIQYSQFVLFFKSPDTDAENKTHSVNEFDFGFESLSEYPITSETIHSWPNCRMYNMSGTVPPLLPPNRGGYKCGCGKEGVSFA